MKTVQANWSERETLNLPELVPIFGVNRTTIYELAARDALPVPVIRIGKRRVVSRRAVEQVLSAQHGSAENSALIARECRPDLRPGVTASKRSDRA